MIISVKLIRNTLVFQDNFALFVILAANLYLFRDFDVSLVEEGKKLDISTSATRVRCFCSLLQCRMYRRVFEAELFSFRENYWLLNVDSGILGI